VRGGYQRVRGWAAALPLAASFALSGCGLLSSPGSLSSNAPLNMEVSSPQVTAKGVLPAEFTCYAKGKTEPPTVSWTPTHPSARSYALIIDDADAPITPRVYWLVFDIGARSTYIQGQLPAGAREARNSTGQPGYDPPCPAAPHKYRISVYALNAVLGNTLPDNPQLLPTWTAIAPHVIGRGTMTVTACPGRPVSAANPACEQPHSNPGL
jgi:phosphatidylethanolamine-binding protein (PEBP) family uncharacterized protein